MAAPITETISRTPMSWDEYLAIPDDVRHEYFDGHLAMSPLPDLQHQRVASALAALLGAATPSGYEALPTVPWRPAAGQEYGPDVAVFRSRPGQRYLTEPPVLAVEILSSNRNYDLVVKAQKYAELGLRRYWIVDRDNHELLILELHEGAYARVQTVRRDEPAEVDFGIASVRIDLGGLLAP